MLVTVTELWSYNHTDQQRLAIHTKLDQMKNEGKFVLVPFGPLGRSVYTERGEPTKTFTSLDAAKEYIATYDSWEPPIKLIINSFNTVTEYKAYLESVTDADYVGHPGPIHPW